MSLGNLFEEFIIEQRSSKKPGTVRLYRWALTPFIGLHSDLKARDLKKTHLQLYVSELWEGELLSESGERFSDTSINAVVQALKYFTNWLFNEGYITKSISRSIKQREPRVTTKDKPTNAEMIQLMIDHAASIRNKLVLALTADTGGRLGEVASIRLPNINLDKLTIEVTGKVGQRKVTMIPKTAEFMGKYIKYYRPLADHDYLLCAKRKPYDPLQVGGVYGIFKSTSALIPDELKTGADWPHSFRRYVAEVYNEQGDVYLAKQKLGHKKISTTMAYLKDDLKKVQSRDQKYSVLGDIDL